MPNAFGTASDRIFLERLTTASDNLRSPALHIWTLEAAGAIRATFLTAKTGSRLSGYAIGFSNDNLSAFSPGLVLLKHVVEAACNDPDIEILDLGIGEERYKHAWTAPIGLIDCGLARTTKGRLLLAAWSARDAAKQRIRSSKRLWALVRVLRHAKTRLVR